MSGRSVLLVSHDLSHTGAPRSLLRQAGYLQAAGYRVSVWSMAEGPLASAYASLGVPVVTVDADFKAVRRKVRAEGAQFDLVVCNTYRTYRFATAFAAIGRPVVWFIREAASLTGPLASDAEFARSFRGFYNLYTVSAYARDFIAPFNARVRYFNNSVEDRFTAFAPVRPDEVRFGFLGSITPHKGISELVAAYRALPASPVKTSLRIAGRHAGTELGERLVRETAACADIVWLGEMTGDALADFFGSIDVLCVPSYDESSGLSLLEGAMYGKALLSTPRVGANYVIGADNGCIVPVDELGRGLRQLLDGAGRLAEMQAASRRRYLETSTPELERDAVLKMVADNLDNPPPPGTGEVRPPRPFFRKEDVGTTHWRFRIWGVTVLKCRKMAWAKRLARRVLVALGADPARHGFSAEAPR